MSRWKANYDVHKSVELYTRANLSAIYWPTLNHSKPVAGSTVTDYMTDLYASLSNISDPNKQQRIVCDDFDVLHMGGADVRILCDDIEGDIANQTQGYIVRSGERYRPYIRAHRHISFWTSSNASVQLQLTVRAYA